jgi:PAS domain S-box-containing protein
MHNFGSRAVHALPLLIGLAVGLVTLVLWRALDERETRVRDEILDARAVVARTEIEARIRMSMLALLRMANRWQHRGEIVGSQWLPDAELYVRHDPAYRALLWLDRRWSPRLWVERAATHPIVRGTGPGVSPWIGSVLSHCRSEPAAQTLCRPTSGDHDGVLLMIAPVVTDGQSIGFIVGVFDLQALLAGSLETSVLQDYAVAVAEADRTIFQRGTPADAPATVAAGKAGVPVTLPGVTWRVLVSQAPGAGAHAVLALPRLTLSAGLLTSVLLAVLVRLAQTARRRATELNHLNRELGRQMRACTVAQDGLQQREAILRAVNLAAGRLLRAGHLDDAIPQMLRHIGESVGVCRVHVFENHVGAEGEALASQRFEWCAPGIESQMANRALQNVRWRGDGLERWQAVLGRGEALTGHVPGLTSGEQAVLAAQGIVSVLAIPLFVDDEWWGFISFDECATRREWTEAEIRALGTAASVVGAAVAHVRAVTQLRESEERFRQLAENVHEVFWMVDPQVQRVLYVSPAYDEIFGRPRARLCEDLWSFLEAVHPEDRERVRAVMQNIMQDRRAIETEFRIHRPDGVMRWVRSRGFPVRGGQDPATRLAGITEDVTERRHAEEMRVAHAEQQRDTLVREVHHRINNNLQGVMSLLRQHTRLHPELHAVLKETIAQINAVAAIHGLQGRGREVRLGELVSAIVDSARGTWAPTLPMVSKLDGAETIVITEAEAVPVALVVNELVLNAIKHADQSARDGGIEIVFERSASEAMLRITNPAKGVPAGFDYGAGRGLGTGLGLVKSLMPPRGALLAIDFTGKKVEAALTLAAPVVVKGGGSAQNGRLGQNVTTSEVWREKAKYPDR